MAISNDVTVADGGECRRRELERWYEVGNRIDGQVERLSTRPDGDRGEQAEDDAHRGFRKRTVAWDIGRVMLMNPNVWIMKEGPIIAVRTAIEEK